MRHEVELYTASSSARSWAATRDSSTSTNSRPSSPADTECSISAEPIPSERCSSRTEAHSKSRKTCFRACQPERRNALGLVEAKFHPAVLSNRPQGLAVFFVVTDNAHAVKFRHRYLKARLFEIEMNQLAWWFCVRLLSSTQFLGMLLLGGTMRWDRVCQNPSASSAWPYPIAPCRRPCGL